MRQNSSIIGQCHCCHNQQRTMRNAPKLLRYDPTPSPYLPVPPCYTAEDHRRISVIRPTATDLPRQRTNSVSSLDRHSVDSFYTDSSPSPITQHHPVMGDWHSTSPHEKLFYPRSMSLSPSYDRRNHHEHIIHADRHQQQRIYDHRNIHDYRDIPSPDLPLSPATPYHCTSSKRHDHQTFNFTPYLDHNLRHKFTELTDFSIKKRHRTIFTPSQLRKLEEKFLENNFIVGIDRSTLAKQLKLKEHQVKIWFQNRRTKVKQQGKDKSQGDIDVVG